MATRQFVSEAPKVNVKLFATQVAGVPGSANRRHCARDQGGDEEMLPGLAVPVTPSLEDVNQGL